MKELRWLLISGLTLAAGAFVGYLLASSPAQIATDKVPAWLEVLQRVCTSVGGLGTFAALIYVIRQNDLMRRNILASIDGQLYARLDSFSKLIVDHDEDYQMLAQPFGQDVPTARRARLHRLCELAFTIYEQVYKLRFRYGLESKEDWQEWQQNLAHFFQKPYVQGYWRQVRDRYAARFRQFVDHQFAAKAEQV
jgi:hypothetical protein